MPTQPSALGRQQRLMVGGLCAAYGLFYFGRVNVSVVLPLMAAELRVSAAEIGVLGAAFFWVYGLGNFFWGELGSHVSPHRLIGLALLGAACANLAFAFQSSLLAMLALWSFNGLAQAGGWSPMMRILAERLNAAQAKRVSTIMPLSYVLGTIVTWSLVGALATRDNWRVAFWLPGLVLLLAAAVWRRAGIDAPKTRQTRLRLATIVAESRGLAFALLVAALAGFARNGSIIWLPAFILDSRLIPEALVGFVAALTQLAALAGILLARRAVTRSNQVLVSAARLFAAAGLALALQAIAPGWLAIAVLAVALMLLNGAFGLVTSSFPLILARRGRASSVAGSLNMMATFAGGLAGVGVGALVDVSGWQAVFAVWAGGLLLAAAVVWRNRGREASQDPADGASTA